MGYNKGDQATLLSSVLRRGGCFPNPPKNPLSSGSGNRASELAAVKKSSVLFTSGGVRMAVAPGFLYKNQRAGRCPPDIEFASLPDNPALCPVRWLRRYLDLYPGTEGRLFVNSKSGSSLLPGTIAHLICKLIDQADPGKFPKAHDCRKLAASLAWTRGVSSEEICRRAFCESDGSQNPRLSPKSRLVCVRLPSLFSLLSFETADSFILR